ncbi:MAG: 3-keto-5-aminohexanoate cleavage protein [Pseudooceanicola sp.]
MTREAFITCAVTGAGGGPEKNPHVPVTPEQIADDVLAVAEAGAAIAHIHVRDPETTEGSRDTALYAEVIERVRDRNKDIIINTTAGMGGDLVFGAQTPLPPQPGSDLVGQRERLAHVEALRPDICTLDCGSYNVGEGNLVYISTSDQIREGAALIRELGVKPELEIFDLGHLDFVCKLIREGAFDGPVMLQFCLGVNFGAPATTAAMKIMADTVQGLDVVWSAFGVAQMQMPMVAQSVLLGGNVRVGLEDNIWLSKGVPARNVDLVTRARTIIEAMGGSVMGVDSTRAKLGLAR